MSGPAPRTGKFSDAWVTSYLCFGPAPPVWGILKTACSGSGRRRIAPLMWGYVRLPEPAHCGHWALPACVGKLGLSPTEPPLHGGSPRPYGEVSYSGTSSEFSRGSTSLVWGSSGKMSPTPSASGGLPAHVGKLGRTKRGQFSVRGALRPCGEVFERVSLHAGCVGCSVRVGMFCRGSGRAAVKGIIPPTAGKDGGDGYRIAAGRHPAGTASAVPGSPGNPFFGRSACRIYCRRRRGGMRWARHLPY